MAAKPPAPSLDSVTTIKDDGSRFFLHPSDVRGPYTTARRWSALFLIALYAALPWIPVGGNPAVFMDVRNLQFHFFGLTFVAQDLWLAFFLITGLGFLLFYVTALLGRVWCGWACPQTVFLEHVYRRIERWLEGPASERRKLDASPWDANKILRRVTKHFLFVLVSLAIVHIFLAYFVSIPELWEMMHSSPMANWGLFVFVIVATVILTFNFAWFREQLCIVICPYGRLQSALLDDHSMVIGYDTVRGEPRGKVGTEGAGDCIDCFRCVQVCPTGIDIRQGLQMECIGCANCIDACDEVMERLDRPKGLVRYDSSTGLEGGIRKILRPRLFVYTALLLLGAGVFLFSLGTINPVQMSALRIQGAPYIVSSETVRNQFMVRMANKQPEALEARFHIVSEKELLVPGLGETILLPSREELMKPLVVSIPRVDYKGPFSFELQILDVNGSILAKRTLSFIGPDPQLLQRYE